MGTAYKITMVNKIKKDAAKWATKFAKNDDEYKDLYEKHFKILWEQQVDNAVLSLQFDKEVTELAIEKGIISPYEEKVKNCFFITIRPDHTKLCFSTFYECVKLYMERKCFVWYYLTFEQKGVCDKDLGIGYHVHIVAKMKQRSQGEVLRDTISSFKYIVEDNFIDVKLCKNPEQLKNDYLIEYKSKDGHKLNTKEWDTKWRQTMNLDDMYTDVEGMHPLVLPLTSPVAAEEIPIRVTFD